MIDPSSVRRTAAVLVMLAGAAAAVLVEAAASGPFVVAPELWDRPRSGRAVMAAPAVRDAVAAWMANPEARLVIRHARGAEPLLQAEELRAWLVATAVEPGSIVLRDDLPARRPIELEVTR